MNHQDHMTEHKEPRGRLKYTESELMAILKFVVGISLAITLVGIVFVVLYSIIFVTQPLNAMSPIDQKFFELIIPIATFLTGTLSGIMLAGNSKEAKMVALEAATRDYRAHQLGGGGTHIGSPGQSGFSANVNVGGRQFSFSNPDAVAGFAAGASTAPQTATRSGSVVMSSRGKPMPAQDPDPEL
jgi:hypothetical protein